ncbi:hypothetical protein L209DRAFT_91385 [Thermothelomyces heterothallicus CBS 203.75]
MTNAHHLNSPPPDAMLTMNSTTYLMFESVTRSLFPHQFRLTSVTAGFARSLPVVPLVVSISTIPTDRAVNGLAPVNCAPLTGLDWLKSTLLRELGPPQLPSAWRRSTLTSAVTALLGLALVPGVVNKSRAPATGSGAWLLEIQALGLSHLTPLQWSPSTG